MTQRLPRILNYHAIASLEEDPNKVSTSPERFESHMLTLRRTNLQGVSVHELLRARSAGKSKGLIGITFDDGYKDFLQTALPILDKYGFSATLFVVADMLGKENDWVHWYRPRPKLKLLEAADLRVIAERGVEIGSHGMSHPKLPELDRESLEREVSDSRQLLGEVLGEDVEGFAYPYGILDETSIRAVRGAGYAYACAVNTRVENSAYDLPRIPVSEADDALRFAAKLQIHPHYRVVKKFYLRALGKVEKV
jgi:peptidoglycan/xylan/chitin deacetylase (PgdA/CDA1 family)